ncbi:MAG TPA: hypothetical protein VFV07_14075 [Rhizomicrobium sp.]|nr:hypothetical protein [Rhizomicrobium sp.]
MDFSFLDRTASIVDLLAAPAAITAALPLYSQWARNMRGRKTIQIVAVGVVAVAFLTDAADRLGAFGPTRSEFQKQVVSLSDRLSSLESKRRHLQGESDYRRIALYGEDGRGGLQGQLAATRWPNPYQPKIVTGQVITNRVVPLDGYDYANDMFDNVQFEYHGKTPVGLHGNTISHFRGYKTDNPLVATGFILGEEVGEYFGRQSERSQAARAGSGKAQPDNSCGKLNIQGMSVEGHSTGIDIPSCANLTLHDYTYKSGPPGIGDDGTALRQRDAPK